MVGRRFVIVTPVLNGAEYIGETLASISAQTHTDWTHYVVDGGSTDQTIKIVEATLGNEPRRRLLQGADRGLYDAVFKGFDQAKRDGCNPDDICLWINSDDKLMPWGLATMAKAFDDLKADWVTALPAYWDAQGRLSHLTPLAWYPRAIVRAGLFNGRAFGWIQQESTFFTRRLLDSLPSETVDQIRNLRLAGDFLLWRAFAQSASLETIPTVVSGFRSHGANVSHREIEGYYAELRQANVWVPPAILASAPRYIFKLLAVLMTLGKARRIAKTQHY